MAESTLTLRTVVGDGAHAILLEPRGESIRVKPRGSPEFFIPLHVAPEMAAALALLARNAARARA